MELCTGPSPLSKGAFVQKMQIYHILVRKQTSSSFTWGVGALREIGDYLWTLAEMPLTDSGWSGVGGGTFFQPVVLRERCVYLDRSGKGADSSSGFLVLGQHPAVGSDTALQTLSCLRVITETNAENSGLAFVSQSKWPTLLRFAGSTRPAWVSSVQG